MMADGWFTAQLPESPIRRTVTYEFDIPATLFAGPYELELEQPLACHSRCKLYYGYRRDKEPGQVSQAETGHFDKIDAPTWNVPIPADIRQVFLTVALEGTDAEDSPDADLLVSTGRIHIHDRLSKWIHYKYLVCLERK